MMSGTESVLAFLREQVLPGLLRVLLRECPQWGLLRLLSSRVLFRAAARLRVLRKQLLRKRVLFGRLCGFFGGVAQEIDKCGLGEVPENGQFRLRLGRFGHISVFDLPTHGEHDGGVFILLQKFDAALLLFTRAVGVFAALIGDEQKAVAELGVLQTLLAVWNAYGTGNSTVSFVLPVESL